MHHKERIKTAKLAANGHTTREIAKVIGCNQSTIVRTLQKPEVQEIAKQETLRLLQALPDITDTTIKTIQAAKTITDRLSDQVINGKSPSNTLHDTESARLLLNLADKKSSRLNRAIGIEESHAPSHIVQQFNQINNLELTPVMQQALSGYMQPADDDGIIVVETEREF